MRKVRKNGIIVVILFLSTFLFSQNNEKTITKEKNKSPKEWDSIKTDNLHRLCNTYLTKTLVVYKDGKVVYTYGELDRLYNIFSVRKSLVSLLYGIYEEKGFINVNRSLDDLGINDLQKLTKQEKSAKVIDLLKAKSGVYHPAAFETPKMWKKRPKRGSYKPGEFWFYNNWDYNVLTTIFEKETKMSLFDAFRESIAIPLQFEDFKIEDQKYILEKNKSLHAATLWKLSARDLLKLGVVLLNKGKKQGITVIPQNWIEKSTLSYSNLGILGGYGLSWWVAHNGEHYPFVKLPNGTFSARGTGEQSLVIIPKYNMVIVHQTEVNSPSDKMMRVTQFGMLLKTILQ